MKKLFSIFFLFLFSMLAMGQDLKVASFEHNRLDLSARSHPRVDLNGQPCALLKVLVMDDIVEVQGNVMGDVVDKGSEKWIYLTDHTKQVRLLFKNHFPLMLTFDEYGYPIVTEQMTYEVKLVEPGVASAPMDHPVSASTSTPASDPLAEAKRAYENENYSKAMELFKQHSNDMEAQFYIGRMYDRGEGVEKNYQESFKWFRKSAEQGYMMSQNNVGNMYQYGDGTPKDYKEALKWYRKSAEQGYEKAKYNLGNVYYFGYGVPKDEREAYKWYKESAEAGDANGQAMLGMLYFNGYPTDPDYEQAMHWFKKAASQGNDIAMYEIGRMYYEGLGVEKDLYTAIDWIKPSADLGNVFAKEMLSQFMEQAKGFFHAEDYGQAYDLFMKMSDTPETQYYLGDMFYGGKGVQKNITEALQWYKFSAEQGYPAAQYCLGILYAKGAGGEKNYPEALKWLGKAADQEFGEAQLAVGLLYHYGQGVPKDIEQAVEWYRKAAANGNEKAVAALKELGYAVK